MKNNQLYRILSKEVHVENHTWTIKFYDIHESLFFNDSSQLIENCDISKKIKFVDAKNYDLPFRFAMEVKAIQFTCGICPKEKSVFVATKQLGYELAIIRWYRHINEIKRIESIDSHAKKIASIPVENTPTVIDQITFENDLINLSDKKFNKVNEKSELISNNLVSKVNTYNQSLFEKFSDFGLDLTANYKLIRIHLLKFLAILPSLEHEVSGEEIKRIFLESMVRLITDSRQARKKKLKGQSRSLPRSYTFFIQVVVTIAKLVPAKYLAYSIRKSVSIMAKRFIAGEDIKLAESSLRSLIDSGRDATLDQLGELVLSAKEANEYESKVIEIIHGMKNHIMPGTRNKAGINQAHVSIKVSALTHDFKPYSFESTYNIIAPRLKNILIEGHKNQVFVNIDAEHYHYRDIVLRIYEKVLLSTEELKDYKDTGIVVQAYLRDGYKHFDEVVELAKKRNITMPIRLVKGAYWDVETVEATAHNFEAPQFLNKEETDIHFRQLVYNSLDNSEHIQLAVASHNIQDHCFAEALREELFPQAPIIEHQCLHMTYEALSHGLSLMDWPTRNYIPVGNLIVGMAYLVRRIMENSSQVGILTIMRSHKKKMSFETPNQILCDKFLKKEVIYDDSILKLRREFINIYPLRTYMDNHLIPLTENLNEYISKVNKNSFNTLDNGKTILASSNPEIELGQIQYDSVESVNIKINKLFEGYQGSDWKKEDSDRNLALLKLSELLVINRNSLTSLIMLEAGKTIDEAVADVDEAVDFIQFYVKEYYDLMIDKPGYTSKGVFGIIAPWNFPLAIPVGMTVSALITGNTALLKPAEQTPLIALEFLKLARLAGIDESIFNIAMGEGDIGASIVNHELISGVVFTGSKEVGTLIYQSLKGKLTSDKYDFEPVNKTVITEMGGKNAIIVTNNSELDETVSGVIYAAFAHSGQKCSAASRIIIDEKIKDSFITRFVEAVTDLKVGQSYKLDTVINPLVSKEDKIRVQEIVKTAVAEAHESGGVVHIDHTTKEYPGHCVGPAVIELSYAQAMKKESIAQKEIFGPVIHIIPYNNLEQAIELFNSTDFALTGGIFCQSQNDIDLLSKDMLCGNIYINRPNTGARVAIEPFGGFKMSGTGPKAGSVDYLYSFMRLKNQNLVANCTFDKSSENSTEYSKSNLSEFASSSKLSPLQRQERIVEFIDRIINRFEVFFSGINEEQKDKLSDLLVYLSNEENLLSNKEFPNRTIPGQINFDKRDFGIGTGIVFVGSDSLVFSTLVEVIINLFIGNGINLYCTNELSYKLWLPIIKLSYKVGFSPYNVSCVKVDEHKVKSILKVEEYHFVIIDNGTGYREKIFDMLYTTKTTDKNYLVKSFITGNDVRQGDWEQYIKQFTVARSFAVNTMRHGAPLELDF